MRSYDEQEKYIRDRIVSKNYGAMTAGTWNNSIFTTKAPKLEDVKFGSSFEFELYTGAGDGSDVDGWFVDVFETKTEREFTIYINKK